MPASLKDEYYTYDGLNRLTGFARGELTGSPYSGVNANTDVRKGEWGLDQLGNWTDYKLDENADEDYIDDDDLTQTRLHNKVNEIYDSSDAIDELQNQSPWLDPKHDLAGNMKYTPKPGYEATSAEALVCTYDAWNRLIKVYKDNGTTSGAYDANDTLIVTHSYDGANRRISKVVEGNPDVTYDYYYNTEWQLMEVRKDNDTDPLEQYIWDQRYIDAAVCRFRDDDTDGDDIETVYYTQDANYNVTALIGADGSVLERYMYDPYGKVTVLNPNWTADEDGVSDYDNSLLFCGYYRDNETGLYHVRNRMYHIYLGWTQRDTAGYIDGMNLYEYVRNKPPVLRDPFGFGTRTGKVYIFTGKNIESPIKERWESYVAKDKKSGCCYDIGLAVNYTRVALSVNVEDVTYQTDWWGESAFALRIISVGSATVAGVNALVPEPFISNPAAGVCIIVAGVTGITALVFNELADEHELGRVLVASGYYVGWKDFSVSHYYKIRGPYKCPYWWDVDFNISDTGMIDTSGLRKAYPTTLPAPDNVGKFVPDPETWNDWSDRVQVKVGQ